MEPTPTVTGGVIVSTKQFSAKSSSTISSDIISKLENILHREPGTYYSNIRTRGKIFGILEQTNQSLNSLSVSIEPLGNDQVTLQTFVTTFNPAQKFTTKNVQEFCTIFQDLKKSQFCPGIKEGALLPYLNNDPAQSAVLTAVVLIERVEQDIVYRSRECKYLMGEDSGGRDQCQSCSELFENTSGGLSSGNKTNHFQEASLHLHPITYGCQLCEETFSQLESLEQHNLTEHQVNAETSSSSTIKCPFCDLVFNQEKHQRLKSHVKKHHRDRKKEEAWKTVLSSPKITCSLCGKNYSSLSCLEQHERLMHSARVEVESCYICGKTFKKGGSTLWGHIKTHEDGGHICSVCGAKFRVKSYLVRHMRSHDPESKKYGCDICGEKFTRPYLMRQHQQFTHNKNLPFKESHHLDLIDICLWTTHCTGPVYWIADEMLSKWCPPSVWAVWEKTEIEHFFENSYEVSAQQRETLSLWDLWLPLLPGG